ncbi:CD44 antigen isoform X12 [Sciurus carolinensis]|uniref:CD44 antigen isoform X12 n=1 Tax=Sciurus carolinensis TaxID=30640 RepID=UPI001FB3A516|nr:CD44 antigen isoform X12 [Sciurus carolinensis]
MDKLWWRAAWGLCLVQLSLAQMQIDLNITCRYAGVFHVEKNGRYSISPTEAADLCKAFNSTLPTMAQMEQALAKGFETCRYGFIEGHVVIPRINPNPICAANNTGVYILTSNTSHYDTFCFNASAPLDEDCTSVTDLPNSFDGIVTITIVNRDGTRYSKKGEYRTHEEDINPRQPVDEDVSSGSSSERSTSGGYTIFHTHLPTAHPSPDQEDTWASENTPTAITSTVHSNSHAPTQERSNWMWSWFGYSQPQTQDLTTSAATALMSTSATVPDTATKKQEAQDWLSWLFQPSESRSHLHTTKMAGTDSNAISTGWEPNEESEDERDKHVSFSGSGIDDDEDFISSTISTTARVSDHTKQNQDWTQWRPSHSNPEAPLQTTIMTDVDKNDPSAQGENRTQEPQPPLIHHEHLDEEEAPHSTSTTWATSSSTTEEATTQREQWLGNGWHGGYHQTPKEDSHSTAGTTDVDSSHSTTLQPTADANADLVEDFNRTGPISVTTRDQDASGRSHTTHGSGSAGHSSGSQEGGPSTTSGPIRKPHIPEWLIILASLLALALILAVCIAVNSRRRCGQKKKLVINNGNGTVEDRKPSGLNGEASKSQEMVHLVNKESSETPDQFMTADETRNLQNVDMKIGV